MANKYKKFVATAATATLVASAIVPVASAAPTDIEGNQFEGYIKDAIALNLFQDNEKFNPGNTLTRGQVVLILGRYLKANGATAAEDFATNPAFADLKASSNAEYLEMASIVKESGVFTGSNGNINWNNPIKREAMAAVLDRLAKEVTGTSLITKAESIEDKTVADLATAQGQFQSAIQALRDLEISTVDNFNPKGEVKRGQFAKFVMETLTTIDEIKAEQDTTTPEVPTEDTVTPEEPTTPEVPTEDTVTPEEPTTEDTTTEDTTTPEVTPVNVETVGSVKAITVVTGTDVKEKLAKTVEAKVQGSEEKVELSVEWTVPQGFEGKAGSYEFTGTLSSSDKNVVIPEDKSTVKASVTIITEAAYEDAVAAVKVAAEKKDKAAFVEALSNAALELTFNEKNIDDIKNGDDEVVGYLNAIAESFSAATVEEIQAIINDVDAAFEAFTAKVEANYVKAILDATTVSVFKTALYEEKAGLKHLLTEATTSELNAYRTAITTANPTTLAGVQSVIEEVNNATVEKTVAAAENAASVYTSASKTSPLVDATATAKTNVVNADTAADAILVKYSALYTGEDVFDVKASKEDAAGKYATRLVAVEKAITEADAAVKAAQVAFDIKSLTPTIVAKQVAEVVAGDDKAQSHVDVTVKYPTIDAEKTKLYGNEKEYLVDSLITVPATFAGAPLVLTVDGNKLTGVVPAVAKEGDTTISFSLADFTKVELSTLGANEAGEWTVSVAVPYETTTLKADNYNITFASVISKNFDASEKELEVLTVASTSLSVKVIEDPAIPAAIQTVFTAAKTEEGAADATLTALTADVLKTAGLTDVKEANAAAYATAFKAANASNATIATIQEVVNAVNEAEALKVAIDTLVKAPSLTNLQVSEFGYSADTTKNALPLVAKNEALYVEAIQEAVKTQTETAPAFTTVADVKAIVEAVNASPIGTLNAQTTIKNIETALLALNDEYVTSVFKSFDAAKQITVLYAINAKENGFTTVSEVIDFLIAQ